MKLEERIPKIVQVLNSMIDINITARSVAKFYMKEPTSSDILTTGTILNTMNLLGLVYRINVPKGKSVRVFYKSYKELETTYEA